MVIVNLGRNAIESKDEGVQVTIHTAHGHGRVHLAVSDDGRGMTKDETKRIFEPFYSTRQQGGHGIGMSIVSRIVQNHGASITVDSTPQVGTTMRIEIPDQCPPT